MRGDGHGNLGTAETRVLTQFSEIPEPDVWLTEELVIPLPDSEDHPRESLEFEIMFDLDPWSIDWEMACDDSTLGDGGVCQPRYAEVHLDQIELEFGTPRSTADSFPEICGRGALSVTLVGSKDVSLSIPGDGSEIVPIARRPERRIPNANECDSDTDCLEVALEAEIRLFELADPCVPSIPCPADLNRDGVVGGADLTIMFGAWGACVDCPSDLNGDGVTNGADLTIMFGAWGPCP
jgi:hypothetical protein